VDMSLIREMSPPLRPKLSEGFLKILHAPTRSTGSGAQTGLAIVLGMNGLCRAARVEDISEHNFAVDDNGQWQSRV
jgi:hypothetical protein